MHTARMPDTALERLDERMTETAEAQVFLNGRFVPRSQATLDVEDRGALFGDGVYEVLRFYRGKPLAPAEHLQRLCRSLAAIRIEPTPDVRRLPEVSAELLERNRLRNAVVYWQVTRGSAPREHLFPPRLRPTVLALAYAAEPLRDTPLPAAVRAVLLPDLRWHLCSIKSLMLLPNVLAKAEADAAGACEAILHRQEMVTEGSSSNIFIARGGAIWTHPADNWILGGITRDLIIKLARQEGITVYERTFTTADLLSADEVMMSNTTGNVVAITTVGDRSIGSGGAGPLATRLHRLLVEHIQSVC